MDKNISIDELVKMLDSGMESGVGHININCEESEEASANIQTMGCTDCSRTPLACSVPTLHEGLDDYK